jgi:hypothetical protein
MQIRATRSGGILGVREELGPIDTDAISGGLGDEIEAEVEKVGFFDLPSEPAPHDPWPDAFYYGITVEDGDCTHSVSFEDGEWQGLLRLSCLLDQTDANWRDLRDSRSELPVEWLRGEAWYNRMPGRNDENLHAAGTCRVRSSSAQLELEPGNSGIFPEPGVVVLSLKAAASDVGDDQMDEKDVSWAEDVGPDAKWVRIIGAVSVSLKVGEKH